MHQPEFTKRQGESHWENSAKLTYKRRGKRAEHIVIYEEYLGRPLKVYECVHHKDHDAYNNDLSNLQLMTRSKHASYHNVVRGIENRENRKLTLEEKLNILSEYIE